MTRCYFEVDFAYVVYAWLVRVHAHIWLKNEDHLERPSELSSSHPVRCGQVATFESSLAPP